MISIFPLAYTELALRTVALTAIWLLWATCPGSAAVLGQQRIETKTSNPSNDLQKGIELLEEKKYAEARQAFMIAIRRNPSSAKCFFYLAMAEDRLHDLPSAEKHLRVALDLDPRSGSVLYNLGVLLLEEKKSREAIRYLERAAETSSQGPELSVNLIRAYLEEGNQTRALELAQSARRRYTTATFCLTLGEVLLSYGLTAQARSLLEDANRAQPGKMEIVLPLTRACLEEGDSPAAREALSSIKQSGETDAEYHMLLAQSYLLANDKEKVLAEASRAVDLSHDNPLYLLRQARFYQKFGHQDKALGVLAKAARLAPDLPDIPYSIGVSQFIADDFAQAAHYAGEAARLDPRYDRALFLQGIALFAMSKDNEAERLLRQAIRLKPRNPFYHCFEGMLLSSESRDAEAEQRFRTALEIYPSYALAHYRLGQILERKGEYAQARLELEKAIALQPQLTEAYFPLGHLYMRLGEKAKAQQALAAFRNRRAEELSERQEILRQVRQTFDTGR